ncbi:PREDICTED: protein DETOXIFICATION 12-like isoform X2 [Camelina sativa]|uniref:Protein DETOXIFICATION n=1 Tax=Camelina sativa TaxID=90675 RepID=A0ABM0WV27_CAMSA|nr:PREDICTED: protein DETOXIFICATION 12-like isoform X1 [Camelina sativa]XP_019095242.1 PREDICTED: protein DETOXIFICATION 12-like isoform X2 [Camelina sativa]
MGDAASTSADSLLLPVDRFERVTWRDLQDGSFVVELKRLICFAAPMAAVVTAQFMLQIISMMMVGHLGNLSLAGASLASSFCNVTGFSLILGLSCALDTLSGQAFGAKLYRKLGVQTYTAMFCIALVCLPLSLIWFNMEKLLVFLGQDPSIAHEAGNYAAWLIPGLFAYAVIQPLTHYFQNQTLITPLLITSCFVLCLHVPLCWLLVYKSGLGNLGGALALSLSNWLNAIFLGSFMYYSSACSETRAPLSMEIFDGIVEFFKYALPSAAMLCLEWWSYELIILLSGLLPNPELETSVLAICLQTTATIYSIHLAIAAAASTRISNELGAGNSRAAHIVVYAAMFLAVVEPLIVSTFLLVSKNVFGYIFSSDKETIDYVAKMVPLVSISLILDSLQGVLSGIARGCGWQHIGAYINFGAFYLWGIPIAISLAYWVHLKAVGLWIGIQAGAVLQTLLLALFTGCTNWENQVHSFAFCPFFMTCFYCEINISMFI